MQIFSIRVVLQCAFAVAMLLIPAAGPASAAQRVVWSSPAMGCVPTSTTVEESKYVTTAGRVKMKPGASGLISFICPLTEAMRDGKYLVSGRVEGTSSTNGIGLSLRRANKDTGRVETITSAATLSTQNDSVRRFASQFPKKVNFRFERYTYWVQITIQRPGAAFLAVELVRL